MRTELFDVSPLEVARQLSLMQMEVFRAIKVLSLSTSSSYGLSGRRDLILFLSDMISQQS